MPLRVSPLVLLALFTLATPLRAMSPRPGLSRLRSLYVVAVAEERAVEQGLAEVRALRGSGAAAQPRPAVLLSAYEGALVTLRAKHGAWPPARLRHMRDGLRMLDAAVERAPDLAEARYLRLMSCYYLPAVLGRRGSVREDFRALARLLPQAASEYPPEVYAIVVRFVLERGDLSQEEQRPLRTVLAAHDDV